MTGWLCTASWERQKEGAEVKADFAEWGTSLVTVGTAGRRRALVVAFAGRGGEGVVYHCSVAIQRLAHA